MQLFDEEDWLGSWQGDDDDALGHETLATHELLSVASRFKSGRQMAQMVAGNGALSAGTGPLTIDWAMAVDAVRAATSDDLVIRYARAVGLMAQSPSHAAEMHTTGMVGVMAELLRCGEGSGKAAVAVAAADAIRHLTCASADNRNAACEAGVVPPLVRLLAAANADTDEGVEACSTACATLRNVTFQHAENQAAVRACGGLGLLLSFVTSGEAPSALEAIDRPRTRKGSLREAQYRAAAALENLAGGDPADAAAIVEAGAVHRMQVLLLGAQAKALSKKAARAVQGRAALLRLIEAERDRSAAASAAAEAAAGEEATGAGGAALAAADDDDHYVAADAAAVPDAADVGAADADSTQGGTTAGRPSAAPRLEGEGATRAAPSPPRVSARAHAHAHAAVLGGGEVRVWLLPSDGALLARIGADAGALAGAAVRVRATVAAVREHRRKAFADVVADGEQLQVAVAGELMAPGSVGRLAMRPGTTVRFDGTVERSHHGALVLSVRHLALVALPADATSLLGAMRLVADGAWAAAAAAAALGCSPVALAEAAAAYEAGGGVVRGGAAGSGAAGGEADPAAAAQAARRFAAAVDAALRGGRKSRCHSSRGARWRPDELAALARLQKAHSSWSVEADEAGVEVADWAAADDDEEEEQAAREHTAVAVAAAAAAVAQRGVGEGRWVGGASAAAAAEHVARLQYVAQRRAPALRWALAQAERLLSAGRCRVAVDVGCGRGDLTLGLARRHRHLQLVGIDSNEYVLARARERAAAAGLRNVRFVLLDGAALRRQLEADGTPGGELPPLLAEGLDLVVALGACGGLADAALALASRHAASALVVPCCYAKHDLCPSTADWRVPDGDKELLCGMADAGKESEVAAPARRVVGCLRLAAAARQRPEARMGMIALPRAAAVMHCTSALWVDDGGC